MTDFTGFDKISAYPITIKGIDNANRICNRYYDHGRAALTEAILANANFCFNPWARNLKPMIAFDLAHRFNMGEPNLPSVEEVMEECQNLIEFIKASREEREGENT